MSITRILPSAVLSLTLLGLGGALVGCETEPEGTGETGSELAGARRLATLGNLGWTRPVASP